VVAVAVAAVVVAASFYESVAWLALLLRFSEAAVSNIGYSGCGVS
jgi:hypothetical protein